MPIVQNTPYYSKKVGELCEGCRRCVKGEKLVLFITGLCPRSCFFCPISDEKYKKDVIYANERKIKSASEKKSDESVLKEIIEEAKLCSATGAGITGGDPLLVTERVVIYIKALKQEFQTKGKRFHIHLYTSLDLINNDNLRQLYFAGLDEIRFHFDLDDSSKWEKLLLAIKYNWKVGIEVPVIPGKEIELKRLIEFIAGKVGFLNLNELETSDNSVNKLRKLGYTTKDDISYAIAGSDELARKLLSYVADNNIHINVHYCTAKLKDKVQIGKRLIRRARNVKKDFDIVTGEGLLVRGAIYSKGFEPGFDYNRKIREMANQKTISALKKTEKRLKKDFRIPENMLTSDERRMRILTSVKTAKRLSKKIKNKCAVVTEYPTDDSLQIEIDFLN